MPRPDSSLHRPLEREMRGRHIFDGHPKRLEDGDLVRRGSAQDTAGGNFSEFARDVVACDRAFGDRDQNVSRFCEGPGTGVHEDPRGTDERRIHLSLIGPARADGAEVGAGLYPLRLHYGLPRRGDERHEVRTFHGVARGCRRDDSARRCRLRGVDERLPSGRVRTPDADLAQCPNVGEGLQVASRLDAGSNQREDAGVLARQQTRRDRRHRAGPRFRDVTAVHDRAKSASRGIEQDDGREM